MSFLRLYSFARPTHGVVQRLLLVVALAAPPPLQRHNAPLCPVVAVAPATLRGLTLQAPVESQYPKALVDSSAHTRLRPPAHPATRRPRRAYWTSTRNLGCRAWRFGRQPRSGLWRRSRIRRPPPSATVGHRRRRSYRRRERPRRRRQRRSPFKQRGPTGKIGDEGP